MKSQAFINYFFLIFLYFNNKITRGKSGAFLQFPIFDQNAPYVNRGMADTRR